MGVVLGVGEKEICEYINNHIKDLYPNDCGAFHIWEDNSVKIVDIEWADGFSGFRLDEVMEYLRNKSSVKKSELLEFTY